MANPAHDDYNAALLRLYEAYRQQLTQAGETPENAEQMLLELFDDTPDLDDLTEQEIVDLARDMNTLAMLVEDGDW